MARRNGRTPRPQRGAKQRPPAQGDAAARHSPAASSDATGRTNGRASSGNVNGRMDHTQLRRSDRHPQPAHEPVPTAGGFTSLHGEGAGAVAGPGTDASGWSGLGRALMARSVAGLPDRSLLKWLYPGMHIKRWLALLLIGVAIMGLGISYMLREVYVTATLPGIFYYLTLQPVPRWARGILFISVSGSLILFAVWHLNRSLLSAVMLPGRTGKMVDLVYNARFRSRGPRVVAIGGGTGLSQLLLGVKAHTDHITAVVTVGDDGGSSGRLREDMGILPPGDVRNCIAALAEAEPLMRSLFQYRFQQGTGLEGHSFGNLFIAALTDLMGGNFEEAVRATSRVLAVRGQIVPSTTADVTLGARMTDGSIYWGESNISHQGKRIAELSIRPEHAHAYPEAVDAIRSADMIVIGPGSLYTSVLPNLLVRDIRDAIKVSRALKVYVSNVATQHGETDEFSVADHVRALEAHVGRGLIDVVLANSNVVPELPEAWNSRAVALAPDDLPHLRVVQDDVVREDKRYHHDPAKLAAALMRLYDDRVPESLARVAVTR